MSTHSDSVKLAWTLLCGRRKSCHLNPKTENESVFLVKTRCNVVLIYMTRIYCVMFNMFNPIYLLLLCLRSYVNVRLFPVVSCMARCCVLFFFKFDLSRAAFCTVQSLSQEELVLFLKRRDRGAPLTGFFGKNGSDYRWWTRFRPRGSRGSWKKYSFFLLINSL